MTAFIRRGPELLEKKDFESNQLQNALTIRNSFKTALKTLQSHETFMFSFTVPGMHVYF